MTDTKDDGGPAFPLQSIGQGYKPGYAGMSLRQYAAIKLCVPDSGTPWLDEMIRQAQRDKFAGQALAGLLAGDVTDRLDIENTVGVASDIVDAMLSARKGE
jgi:hypothetical protein